MLPTYRYSRKIVTCGRDHIAEELVSQSKSSGAGLRYARPNRVPLCPLVVLDTLLSSDWNALSILKTWFCLEMKVDATQG